MSRVIRCARLALGNVRRKEEEQGEEAVGKRTGKIPPRFASFARTEDKLSIECIDGLTVNEPFRAAQ